MKNPYFSSTVVNRVIQKEDIDSIIGAEASAKLRSFGASSQSMDEPNWLDLHKTIQTKYNKKIADHNILDAKIKWYGTYQMKERWLATSIEKIRKYGADLSDWKGIGEYNEVAWYIFLNSNDQKQLNLAIEFMSEALKSDANAEFRPKIQWDTYANLLYKVGRVSEAIFWEQKALDDLSSEGGRFGRR